MCFFRRKKPDFIFVEVPSSDDCLIANNSAVAVSISGHEYYGYFSFRLFPGETSRIVPDAQIKVMPLGKESDRPFDYQIGKRQTWEVREVNGKLKLFQISG